MPKFILLILVILGFLVFMFFGLSLSFLIGFYMKKKMKEIGKARRAKKPESSKDTSSSAEMSSTDKGWIIFLLIMGVFIGVMSYFLQLWAP